MKTAELTRLRNALGAMTAELAKDDDADQAVLTRRIGDVEQIVKTLRADDDGDDDGEIKGLQAELAQLRKDVDAMVAEVREAKRLRSMPSPIVPGVYARTGLPMMRFSHPNLAKEFAEICQAIKLGGDRVKALTPSEGPEGGYLMPEAIDIELQRMVIEVGLIEQIAGPVPVTAGGFDIPCRLAGAIAYWKAAGATGTKSTPSFGRIKKPLETLIALCDVDIEFAEGAMINVGNYLATEMAWAMADERDKAAFLGDGAPDTYGGHIGILNSDRVTIVDMAGTMDAFTDLAYNDLVSLETAVWSGALANARFLAHRTIIALVKQLKDTANMPIWQPIAGNEPSNIIGYPYTRADRMRGTADSALSTTFMAFGDFRRGFRFGRYGSVAIDFSDAPGWTELQRSWRTYERVAMAVVGFTSAQITSHPELANPIAVLKTAAS